MELRESPDCCPSSQFPVHCPQAPGCYDSQDPKCGEDRVSCEAIWYQSLSCGH